MKKILLIVVALTMILNLTSCNLNVNTIKYPDAPETVEGVNQDSYEDNLSGLINYFKDKGYILGEPTKMSAELIGAKEGYRYHFKHAGVKVRVELYEYNLNELNDIANESLNGVRENGKITVQNTSIDAIISDNGKYLMIYTKDKDSDESIKREQEVINDFKAFKR